jgi:hypothetical protein
MVYLLPVQIGDPSTVCGRGWQIDTKKIFMETIYSNISLERKLVVDVSGHMMWLKLNHIH